MKLRILIATAVVLATLGCKDDPAPSAPEPKVEVDAGTEAIDEDTPEYLKVRQAFGLPLPPEVTSMRRGPHYIEVSTSLRLEEIEGFFKSQLVDYEFIRVGRNKIHIVGLRATMPRITVMRRSAIGDRRVRYTQQIGQTMREYVKQNPVVPLKKGDKIKTKLSDGKLLAPGAVYGESYTPQPGDPLYTEGNRANFGKPFGKWVLN